jgi:hypothetical protein
MSFSGISAAALVGLSGQQGDGGKSKNTIEAFHEKAVIVLDKN